MNEGQRVQRARWSKRNTRRPWISRWFGNDDYHPRPLLSGSCLGQSHTIRKTENIFTKGFIINYITFFFFEIGWSVELNCITNWSEMLPKKNRMMINGFLTNMEVKQAHKSRGSQEARVQYNWCISNETLIRHLIISCHVINYILYYIILNINVCNFLNFLSHVFFPTLGYYIW